MLGLSKIKSIFTNYHGAIFGFVILSFGFYFINKIKLLRVITTRVIVIFIGLTLIASCGIYKKTDARKIPMKASDRAKKNIEEGRGRPAGTWRSAGGRSGRGCTTPCGRRRI